MTTTTHETTTGPAVPMTEWPDELSRTKSGRRAIRREIAEWLRLEGLPATGTVWEAVTFGERDLGALAGMAHADGTALLRLDGTYSPAILTAGDFLPDYGGAVAAVVRDPETAGYWVTVTKRRKSSDIGARECTTAELPAEIEDVEIPASSRVRVMRKLGRAA